MPSSGFGDGSEAGVEGFLHERMQRKRGCMFKEKGEGGGGGGGVYLWRWDADGYRRWRIKNGRSFVGLGNA